MTCFRNILARQTVTKKQSADYYINVANVWYKKGWLTDEEYAYNINLINETFGIVTEE